MTSRRSHSDIAIVWFRQDLRLADNPALAAAVDSGARILPVFVYDDDSASPWQPGAASRWWLRSSLASLKDSLNGCLRIFRGEALQIIGEMEADVKAGKVSITSPIARALIGKSVGDVVEVTTPGGARSYEVLKIQWK